MSTVSIGVIKGHLILDYPVHPSFALFYKMGRSLARVGQVFEPASPKPVREVGGPDDASLERLGRSLGGRSGTGRGPGGRRWARRGRWGTDPPLPVLPARDARGFATLPVLRALRLAGGCTAGPQAVV